MIDEKNPTVQNALSILRPFDQKRREALSHLHSYAKLCVQLSRAGESLDDDGTSDPSNLKEEHIITPAELLVQKLWDDIELLVRGTLDDFDILDGPVAEASRIFATEAARKQQTMRN